MAPGQPHCPPPAPPREGEREASSPLVSCQGPCWGSSLDLQPDHIRDHLSHSDVTLPSSASPTPSSSRRASQVGGGRAEAFCKCLLCLTKLHWRRCKEIT